MPDPLIRACVSLSHGQAEGLAPYPASNHLAPIIMVCRSMMRVPKVNLYGGMRTYAG
jgi:hypothetical protein